MVRNLLLSDRHDFLLGGLCAALFVTVAAADLWFPGAVAVSLGHAAIVLLGLAARRQAIVLLLATVGTLAIAGVGVLAFRDAAGPAAIANRGMALVAVWVVAALVYYVRQARAADAPQQEGPDHDNLFQAVFNQTFQFVAALDPTGNIVEANQTLRNYAGLTKSEITSMAIWLLPIFRADPAARKRLQEAVAEAAAGEFVRDEFIVAGIGDRSTVIDFSLKPIRDDDGAICQIIMEARDITEARTQQEMLVHAQKMEAVGALTAGVAHDFNNLLTGIVGNLELVDRRIEGNERARERLRRAIDSAFRGQALTQQLLAFSRRQSLDPAVVDINTLLNGLSQIYEVLGESIEVELDLADELPPCEVDPTLLETALLNLAINARDAMPDGGVLRFQTAPVVLDDSFRGEIADLAPGDYICVAVGDTGTGIPETIASQVFDPFFTTKPAGHGTGLGLSMVYGFVKQSGGDVKLYSEEGKGTTVRIYLPATDKPLPEPEPRLDDEPSGFRTLGRTVLLVEDDEDIRDVVLNGLTEAGCSVESAENGDAAIELLRTGKTYDLVFTDMVMDGDAEGLDVARAARAIDPDVPVILCSGFPRQRHRGEELPVEGAVFLAKPFDQAGLIDAVRRALRRAERRLEGTADEVTP